MASFFSDFIPFGKVVLTEVGGAAAGEGSWLPVFLQVKQLELNSCTLTKKEERVLEVVVKTVVVWLTRPGLSAPDIFFSRLMERVKSMSPL